MSDTGTIAGDGWVIEVEAMKQPVSGLVVHLGEVVEGAPAVGDRAKATVDSPRRKDITRNHTATHLLHAALRNQLGTHVQQRGSLVAPDRLRFDFSHPEKLADEELAALCGGDKRSNTRELSRLCGLTKPSIKRGGEGAIALFGEKYADTVRAVSIAAGRRPLQLRTLRRRARGQHSRNWWLRHYQRKQRQRWHSPRRGAHRSRPPTVTCKGKLNTLNAIARQVGADPAAAADRIRGLQSDLGAARREIESLRRKLARDRFNSMIEENLESLNGVQALVAELDNTPMETMREMTDWFRNRVDNGVMVLASDIDGKPQLVVAVSDSAGKKWSSRRRSHQTSRPNRWRRRRRATANGASRRRRQQQDPPGVGSRARSDCQSLILVSHPAFHTLISPRRILVFDVKRNRTPLSRSERHSRHRAQAPLSSARKPRPAHLAPRRRASFSANSILC